MFLRQSSRLYVTATKDYYKTLNISRNSSKKDIKSAFYKLSKVYHPDLNETGDSKKFLEITEAYNILSNDLQRREYDASVNHKSRPTEMFHNSRSYRENLNPNDFILYRRRSSMGSAFNYEEHQRKHYKQSSGSDRRKYEKMYYQELYEKRRFKKHQFIICIGFFTMLFYSDLVQTLFV
jgi:DnaJ-class molecular chaperone